MNTMGNQIIVPSGSLFYVPDRVKYDLLSIENYALQYIPEFSTPKTEQIFEEIYQLFSTEKHTNVLKAIGIYYSFYAEILPHMKTATLPAQNATLLLAMDYIEKNVDRNFGIDELAVHCSISESRLHHSFQNELKTTPIKYRNRLRVENAASDLLHTDYSMEQIADRNGFHSTTYFREIFKQYMKISPSIYRKKAFDRHL